MKMVMNKSPSTNKFRALGELLELSFGYLIWKMCYISLLTKMASGSSVFRLNLTKRMQWKNAPNSNDDKKNDE